MISSLKEEYGTIVGLGGEVLCVSSDGLESHAAFCDEMGGCPFPIATDPDGSVAEAYGAREPGEARGVRAVYVLDPDGMVAHKIPWYQPGNIGQFMEVFQALGLE